MQEPQSPPPDPRNRALLGLAIVLGLVLGGLFLSHVLHRSAQLQDCVMSGRTNCAPLDPHAGN